MSIMDLWKAKDIANLIKIQTQWRLVLLPSFMKYFCLAAIFLKTPGEYKDIRPLN